MSFQIQEFKLSGRLCYSEFQSNIRLFTDRHREYKAAMGQTLSRALLQKPIRLDVQDAPSAQHEKALRYCARIASSIWESTAETKVLIRYDDPTQVSSKSKLATSAPKYSMLIDNEVYTVASVKAIQGSRNPTVLESGDSLYDLTININPTHPWYTGYDGRVPEDKYDLVTVCLHEMIHGLFMFSDKLEAKNLLGTAKFQGAVAETGNERFHAFVAVETKYGDCSILSYRDTPRELYRAITSGKLYFRNAERRLARLYGSQIWRPSLSINHIDPRDSMNLMKPVLEKGEAFHHIDDNVREIMNTVRDRTATKAKICGRGYKYEPPANIFTFWPLLLLPFIIAFVFGFRIVSKKKQKRESEKPKSTLKKLRPLPDPAHGGRIIKPRLKSPALEPNNRLPKPSVLSRK